MTQLRLALEPLPAAPLPEHLEDAGDWVGQPEGERGLALRGLLRSADRILRSRAAQRPMPQRPFPRFQSDHSPREADAQGA